MAIFAEITKNKYNNERHFLVKGDNLTHCEINENGTR